MKQILSGTLVHSLLLLCVLPAVAQRPKRECRGPIYNRKDVPSPAKILGQPDFSQLYKALGSGASGRVTMEAVLCRSGRVTDIRVIDSQPSQIGSFVADAVSLLSFKPAEMNWHTVSQRQQFEFRINERYSQIDKAAAAGRLVEDLELTGYRRLSKEQLLEWIKTRPGEPFRAEQIEQDLKGLLATGYFSPGDTRVTLEDGARGGVRVIFELKESPLIASIKFEGVADAYGAIIAGELERQGIDVRTGARLDPIKLKIATEAIEHFLESQGWRDVKAVATIENLSSSEVAITVKISGYKPGS